MCMCHGTHMEVRGQVGEVSSPAHCVDSGVKLWASGLLAHTFTHLAISLACFKHQSSDLPLVIS